MKLYKFIIPLLFLFSTDIVAQQTLTLENALQTVLKNNYSILVTKNETEINKNLATPGTAGMLPEITLNASGSWAQNNTKQKFATGSEVNRNGAVSTAASTGIGLNWILFDGMRMFAAYDRLKSASEMSDLALKIEIENTIEQVITLYYSLVKQKQLIASIENDLLLYGQRLSIAETKFTIGSGSKIDLLQSKVDMNERKSSLIDQKKIFNDLKIKLNELLNKAPDSDFDVASLIPLVYNPVYSDLKKTTVQQNNQLLLQERNNIFFQHSLKEIESERYPRISLNTNYNFSHTENQAGIVLFNQNLGLNAGLTLSWTLFDGFTIRDRIDNATIQLRNSQLNYNEIKVQVDAELLRTFNDFNYLKEKVALEEDNIKMAKENVEVTLESFKLGAANTIMLKEAQKSYEDAQIRLLNVQYDLKIAETRLMKLNGALVQ